MSIFSLCVVCCPSWIPGHWAGLFGASDLWSDWRVWNKGQSWEHQLACGFVRTGGQWLLHLLALHDALWYGVMEQCSHNQKRWNSIFSVALNLFLLDRLLMILCALWARIIFVSFSRGIPLPGFLYWCFSTKRSESLSYVSGSFSVP